MDLILPNAKEYFLPIALFSFILDLDHVPSYIKVGLMSKKEKSKLKIKDYVELFRTPIQEPIGILTIETINQGSNINLIKIK